MGPRAVVTVVAALSLLASVPPADAGSLEDCAQRVIRDWYSGGRIDKVYPLPCYRGAIRALPDDVLQYTDATHDIARALAQARHGQLDRPDRSEPAPVDPAPTPPVEPRRPSPVTTEKKPKPVAKAVPEPVPTRSLPDGARVASVTAPVGRDGGVPYPLIVLAVLAPVLLVSGLVGALSRRGC
jgi:hypothetical protein